MSLGDGTTGRERRGVSRAISQQRVLQPFQGDSRKNGLCPGIWGLERQECLKRQPMHAAGRESIKMFRRCKSDKIG